MEWEEIAWVPFARAAQRRRRPSEVVVDLERREAVTRHRETEPRVGAVRLERPEVDPVGDGDLHLGIHRQGFLDIHLQQISHWAEITTHQRAVQRPASNVVPQRLRFRVLRHEEPIVEARVTEVVQLAIDVGDQTGPCVARRSKRRYPNPC